MKKIYTFLFAAVLIFGAAEAQSDQTIKSLSIYDFTSESFNKSYTDSQGNSIKISKNDPSFGGDPTFVYSATVDNPLHCIGDTPANAPSGDKYSSLIMVGHATAKTIQSPQILIEVAGNDKIREIEILAYATPGGANQGVQAELICAFSAGDDPDNDDDFMINMFDHEEPLLFFNQAGCPTDNLRIIPEGTKFIKLIAADSFGWTGVNSYACKPQLHAINFYAKDMGTSIGEETAQTIDIQTYGRNLQLNETADVIIYDITGKIVSQLNNIDNAYLDFLSSGLYVIKAEDGNGNRATQKVVIR